MLAFQYLSNFKHKDEEFNLHPPNFLFFVLLLVIFITLNNMLKPMFMNLLDCISAPCCVCVSLSLLELSIDWF